MIKMIKATLSLNLQSSMTFGLAKSYPVSDSLCELIVIIFCWPIIHLGPNLSFYHVSRLIGEEMGLIKHDQ
jgi:hypothetical protein